MDPVDQESAVLVCIGCTIGRDHNTPACNACLKGSLMKREDLTRPPVVDWELYEQILKWVRTNGGRFPGQYTGAIHDSLREAGVLRWDNGAVEGFVVFDGQGFPANPYSVNGMLYFKRQEDAAGYAKARQFESYNISQMVA